MSKSARELVKKALQLPEEERAGIVIELLDSLSSAPPHADRTDEQWIEEVERRARAAIAGSPGVSWEEARVEITKRLQPR